MSTLSKLVPNIIGWWWEFPKTRA